MASPRPDRMKTTVLYQSCVTPLTFSRVIVRNAAASSAPVGPIGICPAMSVVDRMPLPSVDLKASASQVAKRGRTVRVQYRSPSEYVLKTNELDAITLPL